SPAVVTPPTRIGFDLETRPILDNPGRGALHVPFRRPRICGHARAFSYAHHGARGGRPVGGDEGDQGAFLAAGEPEAKASCGRVGGPVGAGAGTGVAEAFLRFQRVEGA